MIIQNFNYVALGDDDNITLHSEIVSIPEGTYAGFKTLIENDARPDAQTEGMIKNLLRHGAVRVDGENGEAAITVRHFNDEASLAMFRAGGELDAHDEPLIVMEKHYADGKPDYTVGYDHSGIPNHVTFKDGVHSHFLANHASHPAQAFAEMHEIVSKRAPAPRIGVNTAYAMTA